MQKKHIRNEYFFDDELRDSAKAYLNSMGFYCLSIEPSGIEVYALEERLYLEEKLLKWIKEIIK